MLFNSYIFVFLFLPAAVAGYFILNRFHRDIWAKCYLFAMSLWFYGYFNYRYLPVILSSLLVNYVVARLLEQDAYGQCESRRKVLFGLGLVFNIGLLFYFKYYNFFLENINSIFGTGFVLQRIVLPLGISFFTFQQLSYITDVYRGEAKAAGFLDYSVFITFFPQLVAGPIVTHDEMLWQLRDENRRRVNYDNIALGFILFTMGLFKKVIIADTFGGVADWGFEDIAARSSLDMLLAVFSYTMQIYYDFSAYSDMAIGIGRMFNLELPQNFNSPYQALSVPDFWKRWHMTLTRFLTKYIYYPLGGSRRGKVRTYINIMLVFLVSGLWHGASWTFVLWGALHGVAQVLTRMFQKGYERLWKGVRWLLTFTFINAAWLVFRAETVSNLKLALTRLLTGGFSISVSLGSAFGLEELSFVGEILHLSKYTDRIHGFYLLAFYLTVFIVTLTAKNVQKQKYRFSFGWGMLTCFLLLWCIFSLSGVMRFLYFNF